MSVQKPLIQPNAQNEYKVEQTDLPLSCPMPEMYLWNSPPRVYLPIEQTGWAKCPYCGAAYLLGATAHSLSPLMRRRTCEESLAEGLFQLVDWLGEPKRLPLAHLESS